MTIIDRIRSVGAARLAPKIADLTSRIPGLLGVNAAGAVSTLIAKGPKAALAQLPSIKSAPDLILGELDRRKSGGARGAAAKKTAQRSGGKARGGKYPEFLPFPWPDAPLWGGLTLDEYRKSFVDTARTPKSWKNLFFVKITELQPSKESPGGAGDINLLVVDVSFGPCTMPGEAVNLGGAVIDHLSQTERVEIRMTTMDDARGSLTRWFEAKCDQQAHTDGTFGLPAQYLMQIEITQMDPSGKATAAQRAKHSYLVRASTMDKELSRGAGELEQLQLSFVQFDTFMVTA